MKFKDMMSGISGKNGIQQIVSHEPSKITVSRTEFDDACKKIRGFIENENLQDSVNWVAACLWCREEATLAFLKKSGLLRKSKSNFKNKSLTKFVDIILKFKDLLALNTNTIEYFISLSNMYDLSVPARTLHNEIIDYLRNNNSKILKSLLVWVDLMFMLQYSASEREDADKYEYYSNEEVSEAVSYLIFLFSENIGIETKHTFHVDEELLLRDSSISEIIVKACKLKNIMKFEMLVDLWRPRFSWTRK